MPVREHLTTAADGLRLCADVYGEPTDRYPVVCIPGLTRNARDFTPLAERLSRDRLVVAVDLRGRGRSGYDGTARSYRLDVYAEDVFTVLDALSLDRVAVVGTSLGGQVAMRMGAADARRVAGVVLNDIGPELDPAGAARIASYAGRLTPVTTWEEAVAQTRMVSEIALPGLGDEEWWEEAHRRYREDADGRVAPDHDPGIVDGPPGTGDPWEVFAALAEIPVLLVRGALSDLLAPETVALMAAMHPTMEVVEIPDRGHAPLLHEPPARDAIVRFLGRLEPAGR